LRRASNPPHGMEPSARVSGAIGPRRVPRWRQTDAGPIRGARSRSVFAEVEGTDRVFSQRVFHELAMAGRTKIEPESFV